MQDAFSCDVRNVAPSTSSSFNPTSLFFPLSDSGFASQPSSVPFLFLFPLLLLLLRFLLSLRLLLSLFSSLFFLFFICPLFSSSAVFSSCLSFCRSSLFACSSSFVFCSSFLFGFCSPSSGVFRSSLFSSASALFCPFCFGSFCPAVSSAPFLSSGGLLRGFLQSLLCLPLPCLLLLLLLLRLGILRIFRLGCWVFPQNTRR